MTTTLPALTGSEKQIAWADKLRSSFFSISEKRNVPAELVQKFVTATNAGWWINNKPTANGFSDALISALAGGLISVAEKNELIARYNA